MSNLQNVQRKLATGTTSWLNFEFNCDRGDLLSEKALAVPVGQILNSIPNTNERIKAEVEHPYLIRANGPIRKKPQVDFAIVEKNDKNPKKKDPKNDKWIIVVETKWIGKTIIGLEQIVWDLIRLELLVFETGCKAFFILSGFHKKMDSAIGNTHFYSGEKSSKTLITKQNKRISLELLNLNTGQKSAINEKLIKYNLKTPEIMEFNIPHFSPGKDEIKTNLSFETIVWEVLTNKKTKRISKII